ncbi:MAG: polymer-forming cytoskeletal protein [Candidatus Rokubacteria bacterium]|nr:polymer-forming cytoskeletal protein [Candidatus Rokubacteria bacterium]
MGVMRAALGYLGLSGADSDPEAEEPAPRRSDSVSVPASAGIGGRLSFRGELAGEGDFQILGKFEGEIKVTGRVLVGEGAQVDANIDAAAIVIGGTVRGNLSASTRVEILPSGVLTGTLRTGSFSAADGASVKGEIWVERPATTRPTAPRAGG